jgi:uncharacterized membrane protein
MKGEWILVAMQLILCILAYLGVTIGLKVKKSQIKGQQAFHGRARQNR